MEPRKGERRFHPLWWTAGLFAVIITTVVVCSAIFAGAMSRYVPVTLVSPRTGLVMESGAAVKMRDIEVGRVASITSRDGQAGLALEIFPDELRFIPANVEAEIKATTAFGAKYVELVAPDQPSANRLSAGAVLQSRNVATEVNTVFDNLVGLLQQVDVAKLNSVLTALSEGVRGRGEQMGEAITGANQILLQVNPRMDQVAADWRSFGEFSETYGAAAQDIMSILDSASTTSSTITTHASGLDALLLNTIGFSRSGTNLLAPNLENFVNGVNVLEPTTTLLRKYDPIYTCLLQGSTYFLEHGGYDALGGNGRTTIQDFGLLFGDDIYRNPDHLPIVAAKGGPGGQPGCGSLPDVSKNFPVRYQVTNTGWGTGLDVRPNPGIGSPCWANFLPVTRAIPQEPSIRKCLPGPAPGPVVPPGYPPYGAPWYGPDGSPLWPALPSAPPPAAPAAVGGPPLPGTP